ncbi:hypothetical protein B0J15DRAFT_562564, partial [Fusarium solani]
MKTEYNFEASIRSYRQHFDIWDIGKYNCKKRQRRQQRRHQSLRAIRPSLPSPLPSLSSSSDLSDPGPSPASTCTSQRSLEQAPLPAIQQPPRCTSSPCFDANQPSALHSPSLPEPRIKIENGGGGMGWTDVPRNPS